MLFQQQTNFNLCVKDLCFLNDERIALGFIDKILILNQYTYKTEITIEEYKLHFSKIVQLKNDYLVVIFQEKINIYTISNTNYKLINEINLELFDENDITKAIYQNDLILFSISKFNKLYFFSFKDNIYQLNFNFEFNEIMDFWEVSSNLIIILSFLEKLFFITLFNIKEKKKEKELKIDLLEYTNIILSKKGSIVKIKDKLIVIISIFIYLIDMNKFEIMNKLRYLKPFKPRGASANRFYRIYLDKHINTLILYQNIIYGFKGTGTFIGIEIKDENNIIIKENNTKLDENYHYSSKIYKSKKGKIITKSFNKIIIWELLRKK